MNKSSKGYSKKGGVDNPEKPGGTQRPVGLVKDSVKEELACHAMPQTLLKSAVALHSRHFFRNCFLALLITHLAVVMFSSLDFQVHFPNSVRQILNVLYNAWPFPTMMTMDSQSNVTLKTVLMKMLEILVILVYFIELLPQILVWKKPLVWKIINAFLFFVMAAQVPLSMITIQSLDLSEDERNQLKFRTTSICISFLILLELMSEREHHQVINTVAPMVRPPSPKGAKTDTEYTWEEIIEHDRRDDCWVVIHGKVYDVTKFVPMHPGGDLIYDGAGGDCTPMWESYHPLATAKRGPPQRYMIGKVRDYKDFYDWGGEFYDTVKKRVEEVISPEERRYDPVMYIKFAVIVVGYCISLYYFIVTNTYMAAIMLGFFSSQMGVNIMHDGNHKAFSSKKWLNTISGATLDFVGSSSIIYKRSHDFGHHGCVNHLELDRAFDTTYPILRLHDGLPWVPYQKHQGWYGILVYFLVNFGDLFGSFDEIYYFSNFPGRYGHISKKAIFWHFIAIFWAFTSLLFIPWYFHSFTQVYLRWWVSNFVFSCGYAYFFAVNHWTEEAKTSDFMNVSENNWGVVQVENSSNFGCDNPFWQHISGGLNLQIEHHLFPGYIHTRLHQIKPIVEQTCKEFGIRYFAFPDFFTAVRSHMRQLEKLGRMPDCYKPRPSKKEKAAIKSGKDFKKQN